MSTTASYVIKCLVLPPASLIILAIVGLVFRKRKFGLSLTTFSLLLLLLLSMPAVVNQWAQIWERFPSLQLADVQAFRPEALVVIGGGVVTGAVEYQTPFTLNTRTLVRVRYAAKLAGEFGLPILVSGGLVSDKDDVDISEAELMAEVLEDEFKTPVSWQEHRSRNTAENAQLSRELLKDYGMDRIILITQAYHMPRALNEFRKAGFKVLPAPTAFIGHKSKLDAFDFLPMPTALMNSFLLAHEGLGMLWYSIRY